MNIISPIWQAKEEGIRNNTRYELDNCKYLCHLIAAVIKMAEKR